MLHFTEDLETCYLASLLVAWNGDNTHYRTSNCLLAKLKENVF